MFRGRLATVSGRVDVNAYVGGWPFRSLPWRDLPALSARLRRAGIEEVWLSSFGGMLQSDPHEVNAELARLCAQASALRTYPFATLNPVLPDWNEDLRQIAEVYRMPGIRLHPGYHGYDLERDGCQELCAEAARRGLLVQIAVHLEDERTQHPRFQVPAVDCRPLPKILARFPKLTVILLGYRFTHADLDLELARSGRVFFDISNAEGTGVVRRLVQRLGAQCLLLGTLAPLFYPEAAIGKIDEAQLSETDRKVIERDNAHRLLMAAGKPL
ncbi:MAG: hypothetical protein C4297_02635 [Gemmataceae bacterium]